MMRGGRRATVLRRAVGVAGPATLALALLVCGCVFAAMAGPALSLHARSEALQQTMATLAPTVKTVQVNAVWSTFMDELIDYGGSGQIMTKSQLTGSSRELKASLAAMPLRLGGDGWTSISTQTFPVGSGAAPRAFISSRPPKLEVLYREPFAANIALVSGSYSYPGRTEPAGTVAVAVTSQTAARFGLHPGSRLTLSTVTSTVTLVVTAIVRPRGAGSTFWTQDPLAAQPSLVTPPTRTGLTAATRRVRFVVTAIVRPRGAGTRPAVGPYWAGAAFADPGQLAAIQTAFSSSNMELTWEFPLALGGLTADQAQGLYNDLNRATTATPALTGSLQAAGDTLTVTSSLIPDLSAFLNTQSGIETVVLLLSVSLLVIAAAVILLVAAMIVIRRAGELSVLRARGGSLRQVTGLMTRGAVVAAVPAAVAGAAVAIAAVPGDAASPELGWVLAAITLAVALTGPALIAGWQYRRPAPAINPARITTADTGRRRAAWRRPVAEITACAACVAGLIVLRGQGVPAGGQVNLLLTVAPVLVAVPVVVIMLRLYPLIIRGLLRLSARGTGATGFVALSAAARSSPTGVLPAFALVLALSLATFTGMVSGGIARGEAAASWNATGADVLIHTGATSGTITPAALKAIAGVRGVSHATAVWNTSWVTPSGQAVAVVAVDPASYAAVTASTPFPSVPAARFAGASAALSSGAAVRVLASPDAAAVLGHGPTRLTSPTPAGPFSVRVAGILSSTPAEPGGGAFVVMPQLTLPGQAGQPAPNMVLLSGSAIDASQLAAVVNRTIPYSTITFRSAVLASLTNSPLPHGAVLIVWFTLAEAAVLGLLIVTLGLALGSADRQLTLARLTVMGHQRGTGLVITEAMPAVLAAVVAGLVCAVALPHLIGSSIDLSAFTGTATPVPFQPDVTALGLPAAGVVVLAVAALAAQARTLRRRGISGITRAN
jgi:putative ABC transport system permease protein